MARRKTRRRMERGYYRMTPARRAALKKAQLVSAKKRSLNKKKIVAGVTAAAIIGGTVARHKLSGSEFSIRLSRMNAKPQLVKDRGRTRPVLEARMHRAVEPYGSRFDANSPSAPDVTNRHIIANAGVRNLFGISVDYRHRPLTRRNIAIVRGSKTKDSLPTPRPPRKVDRDAIPYYNPQGYKVNGVRVDRIVDGTYVEAKGGSPRFPHMGAKAARRQNRRLRKEGVIP